jgi:hypothetical protein
MSATVPGAASAPAPLPEGVAEVELPEVDEGLLPVPVEEESVEPEAPPPALPGTTVEALAAPAL